MKEASVIPLFPIPWPKVRYLNVASGITLPLVGATVQAGFPSPADDYIAGRIDLNAYVSSNPTSTFLVKVEGDSMIGAHIMPGDLAVVDKAKKPKAATSCWRTSTASSPSSATSSKRRRPTWWPRTPITRPFMWWTQRPGASGVWWWAP